MPDRVVRDFPLFPLGIVAIPHELVPLHIFEERYRTMIGECMDRGTEFGIVWEGEDGVRPIGCRPSSEIHTMPNSEPFSRHSPTIVL